MGNEAALRGKRGCPTWETRPPYVGNGAALRGKRGRLAGETRPPCGGNGAALRGKRGRPAGETGPPYVGNEAALRRAIPPLELTAPFYLLAHIHCSQLAPPAIPLPISLTDSAGNPAGNPTGNPTGNPAGQRLGSNTGLHRPMPPSVLPGLIINPRLPFCGYLPNVALRPLRPTGTKNKWQA